MFELGRHLKQSGLDNKENVPWDGGRANPAALEVVRHLVHEIHIVTHEAHRLEGLFLPLQLGSRLLLLCLYLIVSVCTLKLPFSVQVLCVPDACLDVMAARLHASESLHFSYNCMALHVIGYYIGRAGQMLYGRYGFVCEVTNVLSAVLQV